MCGIVGYIGKREKREFLLNGLKELEYRGYDSAGIAVMHQGEINYFKASGKLNNLIEKTKNFQSTGFGLGIAHTRWATHGKPTEINAHPHWGEFSFVIHNGIIENYMEIKKELQSEGVVFLSQTDSEVIVHLFEKFIRQNLTPKIAFEKTIQSLKGAFAILLISKVAPQTIFFAKNAVPLILGKSSDGETFFASSDAPLIGFAEEVNYLEDGTYGWANAEETKMYKDLKKIVPVFKPLNTSKIYAQKDGFRFFMEKEIYEQSAVSSETLMGRIKDDKLFLEELKDYDFSNINEIKICACGTSYHAGLVAKYWTEDIINLPCQVEVASEFRYRNPVIQNNTLFITISQSGETADTLAALQQIKTHHGDKNSHTLSICNVAESSLTRESDLVFLTHAGPEIGVASTKAFTTQLVGLALLIASIGKVKLKIDEKHEARIISGLQKLPNLITNALTHEKEIEKIAQLFADKNHALFLGRGTMYPIAMEGALKLKEISYIHAEAYPAGELKHGPLALIDENMPVVVIAPLDDLLEKLKSNMHEVKARGGQMIVFEDEKSDISSETGFKVIEATTNVGRITAPITYNILLQLLSYHVALIKGTDVDQPRNLAKSVTVE